MWRFSNSKSDKAMVRVWTVVLLIFLLIFGGAIQAIWLLLEPAYSVTGAIRIAPIVADIHD